MSQPPHLRTLAARADKVRAAVRLRDEAIAEAHAAGASLREIAAAAGVSHQTVANVLHRVPPS